jgi:hypothetical protein
MVVGCAAPAVYMMRMGRPEIDPTLPVRAAVAKEMARLRELRRGILRMVDWVVGSLFVGGLLLAAGVSFSPIRIVAFIVPLILVGMASRRAARRFTYRLQVTHDELEGWIGDLERV